jgi:hypothetical protein
MEEAGDLFVREAVLLEFIDLALARGQLIHGGKVAVVTGKSMT